MGITARAARPDQEGGNGIMRRREILAGVVAAVGIFAGVTPGRADPEPTGGFHVVPLAGAHWEAHAGLPDANGNASLGLVQRIDASASGHVDVAAIRGFEGKPTSDLASIGFAVAPHPSGIDPCWKILVTDRTGAQLTVHVVANGDSRAVTQRELGGGWTQWTLSTDALPEGTLADVSVGVMVQPPQEPTRVTFDDFSVNGRVATKGGEN
jgi:hypothetical protein